jgi:F-type H+-transporting ATPase subunit b
MEIFHAFGIDWRLITIQGINFLVVLFVLYRYAYTPISALLEKRRKLIDDGLADADVARNMKLRMETEREEVLRDARGEGGKLIELARKQAMDEERTIMHEAQEKGSALLLSSEKKAEEERHHILKEAEREIAKMAILSAEKILREKVANA